MEKPTQVICLDCKWCDGGIGLTPLRPAHWSTILCVHPDMPKRREVSLVTGPTENKLEHCQFLRRTSKENYIDEPTCGPEGKWFEPKVPVVSRLKTWWRSMFDVAGNPSDHV